jgi:nucleotide-binding universal stress UspA family protein
VFKNILLALDGSDHSDHAIPIARDLAKEAGGTIDVVHVREIMLLARSGPKPAHADEPDTVAKVHAQVDELVKAGAKATLHAPATAVGGPAHVIAEIAKDNGSDLIVLGTRGHSAVAGLLLGSVTQRLLHIAPCPVLAVPPASHAVS